jgi:site-specific recombinase XerD
MGEITIREAIEEYKHVYLPARNLAERTREEYTNDLKDLVEFLETIGVKRAGDVGLIHLERYLAKLDHRGYAGSTRKRKTVVIRSLFSFLYDGGHITNNIAKRLIPPLAENDLPRVLTQREYQRLLKACSGNRRDSAIIELLLQTGIRLSELTRLNISDFELPDRNSEQTKEMGSLHIQSTKGRNGRILPLNNKASEAIWDYMRDRVDSDSNIIFLNKSGKPLGQRGIQKVVQKYLGRADIKGASVRSLRHTFGTHHVAKGTSLKTIQIAMGHKDPRSTSLYVSLAEEIARKELQENAL